MRTLRLALIGLSLMLFGSAPLLAGPVNINTADATTLAAELTGIGPALAAEIVRDRTLNGNYLSAEALTRVKGVGARIVEMNKENILTGDARDED